MVSFSVFSWRNACMLPEEAGEMITAVETGLFCYFGNLPVGMAQIFFCFFQTIFGNNFCICFSCIAADLTAKICSVIMEFICQLFHRKSGKVCLNIGKNMGKYDEYRQVFSGIMPISMLVASHQFSKQNIQIFTEEIGGIFVPVGIFLEKMLDNLTDYRGRCQGKKEVTFFGTEKYVSEKIRKRIISSQCTEKRMFESRTVNQDSDYQIFFSKCMTPHRVRRNDAQLSSPHYMVISIQTEGAFSMIYIKKSKTVIDMRRHLKTWKLPTDKKGNGGRKIQKRRIISGKRAQGEELLFIFTNRNSVDQTAELHRIRKIP